MRFVAQSLMIFVVFAFSSGLSSSATAQVAEDKPLGVLLLSGQNNHDWKKTTPKLKSILEGTGRFRITIDEHPASLTSEKLKGFEVILSNWNSFNYGNKPKSPTWSPDTKKAYIEFVRQGGGHVVIHAGSSSFPDWKEYQELTLATWTMGKTGHGSHHEFNVRIDGTGHPIGKSLSNFTYFGELWHRPTVQKDVTIIASALSSTDHKGSGKQEPVAVAKSFGQGRNFTFLLGHSVKEMDNKGFQALLTRGTEWAATGQVSKVDSKNRVP